MTRYVLDTDVLSTAAKAAPLTPVVTWVESQTADALYVASFSLAEIERGVLARAPGRRRTELEAWFRGPNSPKTLFAGRILPFDERAAAAYGCTVVTLNDRDFRGAVATFNPTTGR